MVDALREMAGLLALVAVVLSIVALIIAARRRGVPADDLVRDHLDLRELAEVADPQIPNDAQLTQGGLGALYSAKPADGHRRAVRDSRR